MSSDPDPHTPGHTTRGRGIVAGDDAAAVHRLADARVLRSFGLEPHAESDQPVCVIPNCTNGIDEDGRPCGECLRAFGPHLRTCDDPPLTRPQIAARDGEVYRAYQLRHQLRAAPETTVRRATTRRRGGGHR
ncbi:MAG: hypothetical protein QOJ61_1490 [Mycobacterium sp.]|nr:hypothetical protein [Mycobacterium sp.]